MNTNRMLKLLLEQRGHEIQEQQRTLLILDSVHKII